MQLAVAMRTLLKVVLAIVVLGAAIGSIGGILAWRYDAQKLTVRRQEFLERYSVAMKDAIRSHYFMTEKLPAKATDLIYAGASIRSPWVFDGMVDCRFNRPSLEEGWIKVEAQVFADVIAHSSDDVPTWQAELRLAREPLRQREGDLAAQLDLFCDGTFDLRAGYQFLEQLRVKRGVPEQSIEDFASAVARLRNVLGHRAQLQQYNDAERVELLSAADLAKAREQFEKVKGEIVEWASATPGPGPEKQ
jgi:hypothetical protein